MKNYAVSIVVPVYNVEKYIAKCATTLFEQDFDSIEYIFVNDCSPDNSMQVLQSVIEKYPNRKDDIKIINKPQNEGLGQARKTGFESATGEYIIHIDSDDWIELDMISSMYKKAKEDDADIVCCDYFRNYANKEVYNKENYENENDKLKASLSGIVGSYVWNKFAKKDLYENLKFPNFSLLEDVFITAQLFYKAKKISYLPKAYLHYNKINSSSIVSGNLTEKKINELKLAYSSICSFLKDNGILNKYIKDIQMHIVQIVFILAQSDYIYIFRQIDNSLINKKLILDNPRLSKIKKLLYLLPFFGLEKFLNIIKNRYRKIKYN